MCPINKIRNTSPAESGESSQVDRFRQAARELDSDEDERAFDEKLKKVAKHNPEPQKPE